MFERFDLTYECVLILPLLFGSLENLQKSFENLSLSCEASSGSLELLEGTLKCI